MISDVEYRSVIKFFVLQKKTCSEIYDLLQSTYLHDSPSLTTVKYWVREFKGGRTSVFDQEKSGRPQEIFDTVDEKLEKIVQEERRITMKMLSTMLNISVGTAHAKLKSMGIRKLCSRFVPRFLTGEMMRNRLECSQNNLNLWDQHGETFLANLITEDETPLSMYLPETKRESAEWKLPGEKPSLKMRTGTSHGRAMMLSIFWDHKGVILMDFADKGITINAAYYSQLVATARKNRRKQKNTPLWFLHDNAPVHTAGVSRATIEGAGLVLVDHPPYSPDLAPSDFYLFRHLKKHLRGTQFGSKDDLKVAVEDFFNACPRDFFKNAFSELIIRWRKCVERNGHYVEK
jgi:[histone H3]-lysine36 N-dimethyltransferase SETMAR